MIVVVFYVIMDLISEPTFCYIIVELGWGSD